MNKSVADDVVKEANAPVLESWVLVPGVSRMGRIRYELIGEVNHREVRFPEVMEINFVTKVARTTQGTVILK